MVEKTLIIIIDALGYDLLEQTSSSLNLPNEPVKLVPPYGFGEAALMWSGELPQKTGRWNEFTYNPGLSPFRWTRFLPLKPLDVLRERFSSRILYFLDLAVRKVIKIISARLSHISSPSPYQIPYHKLRYFLPVHDWETYQFNSLNGNKTLFGILKERGITHCYIGYPELRTDLDVYNKSREALKEHQLTISFFFELDSIEHWHGKESPEVSKKLNELRGYVNGLVGLFKKNNPNGSIIMFSDHGMSRVEKILDVESKLRCMGLRDGIDYLSFYDATMARFWFFNEESKMKIIDKLGTIEEGRILQNSELKEAGLNFRDRTFGDLIFVAKQGVMISPNYFQGKMLFRAVHGHCPPFRDEYGFFTTDKYVELGNEIRMENLFKIMLNIMNINIGAST